MSRDGALPGQFPPQFERIDDAADQMQAKAAEIRDATETKLYVSLIERYYLALVTHKIVVAGIIAVCILLGGLLTVLATPQFSAKARIEIARNSLVKTDVEGVREEQLSNELAFYQTQYSLLEARSVAERVARAVQLPTNPDFRAAFKLEDQGNLSGGADGPMSGADRQYKLNQSIGTLMENIQIVPVRGSSLVDVKFTSPNPALSATIANAWVQQFIRASLDRKLAATSDARIFLEERLATLRTNLEDSERALVTYATDNNIVTLAEQTDATGKTRSEKTLLSSDLEAISGALVEARTDRIAAQSKLGAAASEAAGNAGAVSALRQSRAEAAAELAKLRTQFEREYPAVIAVQSQVNALDRSIATELARTSQTTRDVYRSSLQREQQLQAELDKLSGRYSSQRRSSIQFAILQREVDTNRQIYDGLLQRFKEIGVAGVGTNNISIVDNALAPKSPSSPNLLLNLTIALIVGIALSAFAVFALEQMDQSIRDPADVTKQLGLPLLGSIPMVEAGTFLDVIRDKKSAVYEAYLALRTNLTFLTTHGAPRSLMVTSARPQEGKSSSAIGLARVFAGAGKKTVLIDADIRSPSVNVYMNLANKRGLSNYLAGDDDIDGLLVAGDVDRLTLMVAGPMPPNAAELLSQDRFDRLIAALLTRFDQIIIDAPPVLGLADAPLLSRKVEGVLFAIEANVGKVRAIKPALDRLQMSGGKLFGAIVTKIDKRNQAYGYGYGYGSGYGYGYGQEADRIKTPADQT